MHKGTSYPDEHEAVIDRAQGTGCMPSWPRARASARQFALADADPAEGTDLYRYRRGDDAGDDEKGSKLYRDYTSTDLIRNRATEVAGPIQDIANSETATGHFVSRMMRLA